MVFPLSLSAQVNRYFVSFKDKNNSPYSVSNPSQFLSQKSIDRRTREGFATIEEDLPVNATYIQQVKAVGAKVFFSSRWFNGVLVQTDTSIIKSVNSLSFVSKVELVADSALLLSGRKSAQKKTEQVSKANALQNQSQLQMIGLDQLHDAGYHGEGIDIAVFDDGFIGVDTISGFKRLYQEGRLKEVFSFVYNNVDSAYAIDKHGTSTLSILAGNIPDKYFGGAYMANFFLYQTEDYLTEYRVEEYNWLFAAERADSAGIDVISSSLGYSTFDDATMDYTYANLNGNTAVISIAAHKAFLRGISVVNAAGNDGGDSWKYIDVPADAVGVIAVGAVDATGVKALFSSLGPTSDGRIKPDVSALGVSSVVFSSSGCCYVGDGTSFACPLVAGLVADLRQMNPQFSAQEIYNQVISMGTQYAHPDNFLGYGIPIFRLTDVIVQQEEIQIFPNPVKDGQLKILLNGFVGEELNVQLYNSYGQKVFEGLISINTENDSYTINMLHYASGMYYVSIRTSNSVKIAKVINVK